MPSSKQQKQRKNKTKQKRTHRMRTKKNKKTTYLCALLSVLCWHIGVTTYIRGNKTLSLKTRRSIFFFRIRRCIVSQTVFCCCWFFSVLPCIHISEHFPQNLVTFKRLFCILFFYFTGSVSGASFLLCEDLGGMFDKSFPVYVFFVFFFKWRSGRAR